MKRGLTYDSNDACRGRRIKHSACQRQPPLAGSCVFVRWAAAAPEESGLFLKLALQRWFGKSNRHRRENARKGVRPLVGITNGVLASATRPGRVGRALTSRDTLLLLAQFVTATRCGQMDRRFTICCRGFWALLRLAGFFVFSDSPCHSRTRFRCFARRELQHGVRSAAARPL